MCDDLNRSLDTLDTGLRAGEPPAAFLTAVRTRARARRARQVSVAGGTLLVVALGAVVIVNLSKPAASPNVPRVGPEVAQNDLPNVPVTNVSVMTVGALSAANRSLDPAMLTLPDPPSTAEVAPVRALDPAAAIELAGRL